MTDQRSHPRLSSLELREIRFNGIVGIVFVFDLVIDAVDFLPYC